MTKIALKYGSIIGGILIVLFWVAFAFLGKAYSYSSSERTVMVGMVLVMFLVFPAISAFKNFRGRITYSKGLLTGVYTSLIASIIFSVFIVILYEIIDPGLYDKIQEAFIRDLGDQGVGEIKRADLEASMENAPRSPVFQGLYMFFTVFPLGFFISLIAAWILRSRH